MQLLESDIIRFVNAYQQTKDRDLFWGMVRQVKHEVSVHEILTQASKFKKDCDVSNTFAEGSNRRMLYVIYLEYFSKISPDLTRYENIEAQDLKIAGEMFIYLISCDADYTLWFEFFVYLLAPQDSSTNWSPDLILLTLNRFVQGPQNDEALKIIAQQLIMKMDSGTKLDPSTAVRCTGFITLLACII